MPYGLGSDVDSLEHFKEVDTSLSLVPAPKGSFYAGSESRPLASGGARLVGYPHALWHWDFFRMEWYDILRVLLPDFSGIITIETSTNENEDEFLFYEAKYVFPFELEKDSHRRMDFDVVFQRLIEVEGPEP